LGGCARSKSLRVNPARAAVIEVGWHELPHAEVDREVREDVIDEATRAGTLGGSAITEFFSVVLDWADAEEAKPGGDEDGLGPTGAFHEEDASDDHDDEYDDDQSDDDDESDDYESDDNGAEEGDDDEEESVDHDPEDWVGYLSTAQDGDDFTGLPPENEADAETETAAASSFFSAIDSSPPADDEAVVVVEEDDSSSEIKGGVFSAAADHIPPKPASGIDWITVAYFAVAAICFALVIYFYLSSN